MAAVAAAAARNSALHSLVVRLTRTSWTYSDSTPTRLNPAAAAAAANQDTQAARIPDSAEKTQDPTEEQPLYCYPATMEAHSQGYTVYATTTRTTRSCSQCPGTNPTDYRLRIMAD